MNGNVNNKIEKVKLAMLAMQRASWEQGVAAQAFLELGDDDMVIRMAKAALVRQNKEGRLAVLGGDGGVTDPAASGEAVLHAAKLTGDQKLKDGADKMLDYLLNRAPKTGEGILHHTTRGPEIWIDSMYMAPPFLAAACYHDEAVKQIKGFRDVLWNPQERLFSHIWHAEKKEFVREDFWGVGNGWAAAGMARVIRSLPSSMESQKAQLTGYATEVVDGCLKHLRDDGLFHDVVDKPDTFVETNLSQMIAYTIYRGVSGKWLDGSYLESADRMREAAHGKVDEFGLVQGVCGSPTFDHSGTATEGQAFFLLMEAAYSALGD